MPPFYEEVRRYAQRKENNTYLTLNVDELSQAMVDPLVEYNPIQHQSILSRTTATDVLMEDWRRSGLGRQL